MERKSLPEATEKLFKYTGPKGSYRFRHGAHVFSLGQITPDMAKVLIDDGFEYLKPIKKAAPAEPDKK